MNKSDPTESAKKANILFEGLERNITSNKELRALLIKAAKVLVKESGGLDKTSITPERWEKVIGEPYRAEPNNPGGSPLVPNM